MSRPTPVRRESAQCGLPIALALFFGFAPAVSRADVYGYIDEQGVARFAAEKLDDRYQLLSKGNRFGMLTLGGDGSARSALKERLLAHPNLKRYEPLLKAASVEFAVELSLLKAVMAAESGFTVVSGAMAGAAAAGAIAAVSAFGASSLAAQAASTIAAAANRAMRFMRQTPRNGVGCAVPQTKRTAPPAESRRGYSMSNVPVQLVLSSVLWRAPMSSNDDSVSSSLTQQSVSAGGTGSPAGHFGA